MKNIIIAFLLMFSVGINAQNLNETNLEPSILGGSNVSNFFGKLTSNQSVNSTQWSKLIGYTALDVSSDMNLVSGSYTAPEDGIYAISYSIRFSDIESTEYCSGRIVKSSGGLSTYMFSFEENNGVPVKDVIVNNSGALYLLAGDVITLDSFHTNSSSTNAEGGNYTYLSIAKL